MRVPRGIFHNYKNPGSLCQSIHRHLFFVADSRMVLLNIVPPHIVWQQTLDLIIKIVLFQSRQRL